MRVTRGLSLLFAAMLAASCVHAPKVAPVEEAELRADIAYLSSPEMQGRAPGGVAEGPVAGFLIDRFAQSGLSPAFADLEQSTLSGWAQPVVMHQREPLQFTVGFNKGTKELAVPTGQIAFIGAQADVSVSGAKLYFVGRSDAEKSDLDLTGAVVLIQVASTDRERAAREQRFAKAGAVGVIEIVRGREAYGKLAGKMQRAHFYEPAEDGAMLDRTLFGGVMAEERAVVLVSLLGNDWDKLMLRSALPDYAGEYLGASMDLSLQTQLSVVKSQNIGGVIKGRKRGAGAVLFIAHWDHLGVCAPATGPATVICPGAVDNASGITALLHIAEALAAERHDRDIYFIATTGEEHGFIGARTLLAHSPVPPESLLAIFNLDMLAIAPAGTPVAIVGADGGRVDATIIEVMAGMGLAPANNGLADSFRERQDGWVFLSAGLPARMVNSSYGDEGALNGFLGRAYHNPADAYSPAIELGGAMQDIRLHIELGRAFSSVKRFPTSPTGLAK